MPSTHQSNHRGQAPWAGTLLAVTAGVGAAAGLLLAGGAGIALGAVFGAAAGLVVGAIIDARQKR